MRRQLFAAVCVSAVVVGSWVGVPAHASKAQFVKYVFLVTIDAGDSRNDVIGTIRGNGSLLDLIEGRDPETNNGETIFNRYVLKPSLIPGAPEIPAEAWVGIGANVPAVVRNEYSQNTIFWRTIEFRGAVPAVTRQFMQQRLRQEAGFAGATHIWEIIPGDDLSAGADLRANFVPLFQP